MPGAELDGVLYLRWVGDSERLAATLQAGGQVVIVGAGWIGLEVAAAAREFGCAVTVVEPEPCPLYRHLGPELGAMFADLHTEHGVVFRFEESVTELRGSGGSVREAVTSAGVVLPADLVVVGIGAVPATSLASAAGLDVGNGVIVRCRAAHLRAGCVRSGGRGELVPSAASAATSGSSTGPTR